jgi:protein-L-isoaspartate O-methyltransferase
MPASRAPERVVWGVEQLAPAPADHVLEIGCGPGYGVALLCHHLTRGSVTAVDRSAVQVEKARALNRECIASGRARIEAVTLAKAPMELGKRFPKVLAINVNAFWTEPAASLSSLAALLRRGGRAFLVYEAPSAAGLHQLRIALPRQLSTHGFSVDEVRVPGAGKSPMLCVVARKPGR